MKHFLLYRLGNLETELHICQLLKNGHYKTFHYLFNILLIVT